MHVIVLQISSLVGFQRNQLDTLFHPEEDNTIRDGKDLPKVCCFHNFILNIDNVQFNSCFYSS